jgi:DNA mismatch repair ATPase MutS
MSLFESEIEFAKDVKSRLGTEPMFLMMDEIFHGTNASDGAAAARVFLDQLYKHQGPVFSVISTHYMELPESYRGTYVQDLCMEARQKTPELLEYTYRLCEGINRCSSVHEILRERGLCGPDEAKNTAPASKV